MYFFYPLSGKPNGISAIFSRIADVCTIEPVSKCCSKIKNKTRAHRTDRIPQTVIYKTVILRISTTVRYFRLRAEREEGLTYTSRRGDCRTR